MMKSVFRRLLVVEDDVASRKLLLDKLGAAGFEVMGASSAEEAAALLASETFSLMLLDYMLPGKDGADFVSGLPARGISLPPFVVMTGHGGEAVAAEFVRHGAADYLVKDSNFLDRLVPAIERVLFEEALKARQAETQRLEELGLVSGGIAHDFNNLLTAIMANLSLLLPRLKGEEAAQVRDSLTAASTAAGLAGQLLTFARGGQPLKKPRDLRGLARSSAELALYGTGTALSFSAGEAPVVVEADEGQLGQVIMNLVRNASEAMGDSGRVRVSVAVSGREKAPTGFPPGKYARVEISDSGPGINAADVSRIFEPYYSTKPGGRGLGLPVCFSVAKRHGGTVTCSSSSTGAVFALWLPLSDKLPAPELQPQTMAKRDKIPAGTSLLVMDDDELIRDAVVRMALKLGCTCESVEDGAAAVASYSAALSAGRPFSAVVLDLKVPGGMGGREAAEKIRRLHKAAVLVASSGYSDDNTLSGYAEAGFDAALPKPYAFGQLAELLGGLLRGKKRRPLG